MPTYQATDGNVYDGSADIRGTGFTYSPTGLWVWTDEGSVTAISKVIPDPPSDPRFADPHFYSKNNLLVGPLEGYVPLSQAEWLAQQSGFANEIDLSGYDSYAMAYLETPEQKARIQAAQNTDTWFDRVAQVAVIGTLSAIGGAAIAAGAAPLEAAESGALIETGTSVEELTPLSEVYAVPEASTPFLPVASGVDELAPISDVFADTSSAIPGTASKAISQITLADILPSGVSDLLPSSVTSVSAATAASGMAEKIYQGTGSRAPAPALNTNLSPTRTQQTKLPFGFSVPVLVLGGAVLIFGTLGVFSHLRR